MNKTLTGAILVAFIGAAPGAYALATTGTVPAGGPHYSVIADKMEARRAWAATSTTTKPAPTVQLDKEPSEVLPEPVPSANPDEYDGARTMGVETVQDASAIWSLDRLDQPTLSYDGKYQFAENGTGVTIYQLDTGVRRTHADLAGHLLPGISTVGGVVAPDFDDCNGHGTHVAGTAVGTTFGVAKGAKLVPVHVFTCDGRDSGWAGTLAGMNWVINDWTPTKGPAVISMSLGGSTNATLDALVEKAIAKGMTVVIAAMNDNRDACLGSPARVRNAITVGATTNQDIRSSYSNYGSCVDLFAPGNGVRSAGIASDTAITSMQGTSMATPAVAGLAAQVLQNNPLATPAQVQAALIAHTSKVVTDAKGFDGLAQVGATVTSLVTTTTTTVPPTTTTVAPTTTTSTTVKPTTTTTVRPTTTTVLTQIGPDGKRYPVGQVPTTTTTVKPPTTTTTVKPTTTTTVKTTTTTVLTQIGPDGKRYPIGQVPPR